MTRVPSVRIAPRNSAPPRNSGKFVLYWMIASRRLTSNFALDRAIEWATQLKKPLVILEALRCDYPWASDRLHRFVLDGMAEHSRRALNALYYPYIEPEPAAANGLLAALGSHACVVVTDDFPCFFLPVMVENAARLLPVLLEAVDSNGLLPIRAAKEAFSTAFSFHRFLQKSLPSHLEEFPNRNPLQRTRLPQLKSIPSEITRKWPPSSPQALGNPDFTTALPINHRHPPAPFRGGEATAQNTLKVFLKNHLDSYSDERNEPEKKNATSGLSPYLHFGHISAHQVFSKIIAREDWSCDRLSVRPNGSRCGWWGLSPSIEAFLDQLITWRELGFNFCAHRRNYDAYRSLPPWALKTLAKHARDERSDTYTLGDFAAARTHDELWNAAQRQLASEGHLHNYMRMLWGKKILEWSHTPEEALETMIELNNRYALDGRDPNSYSGIFWCLGRYDRPWGPERPIFGTVRYMSSENTARKFHLKNYIRKYAG